MFVNYINNMQSFTHKQLPLNRTKLLTDNKTMNNVKCMVYTRITRISINLYKL